MEKEIRNKKQAGFTLIEIIAVLVILGILAAVAIPKYQNLQQTARQKALDGAIAAGQSQLSMAYSAELLINNGDDNAITWSNVTTPCSNIGGDFTVSCTGGPNVTITATDSTGVTATGSWDAP